MNPVSIEYEVTTGDVAGWLRYQILTSRLYRIAIGVSWLIGGSMMLTSMVGRFGSNWLGDILHGLFVAGTMSGVIFIQFLTTRFQAKRFLRGVLQAAVNATGSNSTSPVTALKVTSAKAK